MITLIEFSGQPLMHALGWTLLHFCWQGAGVAAVLWCVLKVMDGRSSRVRYASACLALGMVIALPVATFAHLASAEYRSQTAMDGSAVMLDAGMVLQVGAGEMTAPLSERIAGALDHALPWIILAWFTGVILFVVRLNVGLMVARRMKTIATTAVPTELQQAFDEIKRRLSVERAVRLMHSALVEVPTVIGWLRPVVLVPASCLSGLSPMQIEAILAHELAHIRRHDYLVSVLQSVIETLLFYHPAVWWVSRQVRRERECCCDELAVAVGGDRLAYARALSVLEERRACMPELVLGANGGVLTMRIKRLLGCGGASISSQLAAGMVLAILMAVAGSYGLTAARAEVNALSRAARATSPMELEAVAPLNTLIASPAVRQLKTMFLQPAAASGTVTGSRNNILYTTWLNQDVLWIITTEERAAFLKLTNDEERDQFINQFWARRDPPGAPANSFREEHYRRIAYSNEHFATNDGPGWRSDRGRTYIMNGEPYSVDRHLTGAAYPYEVWHYRSADGSGIDAKFEDTCQCGKYVLVSGNAVGGTGASGVAPQATARATQGDGTIAGSIVDPTGATVPHAKVTATNTDNGIQTSSETDSSGKYSVSSLYPGPYNVEIVATGYQRLLQENVIVDSGKTVVLNLKLTAGTPTLTLTVTDTAMPGPVPPAEEASAGVKQVGGDVTAPRIIYEPWPGYTELARKNKVEGVVLINLVVDEHGLPQHVKLLRGLGDGLDEKALETVKKYVFKPGTENGKPAAVYMNVQVKFQLADTTAQTQGPSGVSQGVVSVPAAPPVQAAPGGTVRISSGTASGMVISKVDPVYPEIAKAAHVQGAVILHAIISKTGTVERLDIISGNGMLVNAARDAVSQWTYKPYLLNGQPTEVETSITVNFLLADSMA